MISICIPNYNFNCENLLNEIKNEINNVIEPIEVIVVDDKSSINLKNIEISCKKLGFKFFKNKQNIGSISTRKVLAKKSIFQWLLFIDSDMRLKKDNFLKKYLDLINNHNENCYIGGYCYSKNEKIKNLRYNYGFEREYVPSNIRNRNPYRYIFSGNILIKKSIFIGASEKINENRYGMDLMLAINIKKMGVKVLHIENNLLHKSDESNESFLHKIEQSSKTLFNIKNEKKTNLKYIKILNLYFLLRKTNCSNLFFMLFKITYKPLKKILIRHSAPIIFLDLNRLYYIVKQDYNEK